MDITVIDSNQHTQYGQENNQPIMPAVIAGHYIGSLEQNICKLWSFKQHCQVIYLIICLNIMFDSLWMSLLQIASLECTLQIYISYHASA